MSTPLATILCQRGPVTAVAFEQAGLQMVTGGMDGKVKVWDVRKLVPLHTYFAPTTPKSLDISQKGLLAVASGSKIEIWRDALTSKQVSFITFILLVCLLVVLLLGSHAKSLKFSI
jgi:U3 small nucleolar RNA-associated protein 7